MTGFTIRVYTYDATTKEMREVSAREWSVDKMPNQPLIDDRWPLCECHRCRDRREPLPEPRLGSSRPGTVYGRA
ncbi:hypothetical protein AAH978_12715 [Streptomyces sp. ZYX-F-203]